MAFKKRLLAAVVVALLMFLGVWSGTKMEEKRWATRVEQEIRYHRLATLQSCLLVVYSGTMGFVFRTDSDKLRHVSESMEDCRVIIEALGSAETNEWASRVYGEVWLFYDGYTQISQEIMQKQVLLESLYNRYALLDKDEKNGQAGEEILEEVKEIRRRQGEQLYEVEKFLNHIEALIRRVQ